MSGALSAVRRELVETGGALLNLLFPDACAGCGGRHPQSGLPHVCAVCEDRLPRLREPFCGVCGEWFAGAMDGEFRCVNCADRKFDFEFAVAPMKAGGMVREWLHRFKYGRERWLCVVLGRLLADTFRTDRRLADEPSWMLVPVPLHVRRERERRFNQARELCRIAAPALGFPVSEPIRRTRYTSVQASLRRSDRLANLRDAFVLTKPAVRSKSLQNAAVALIDDVFTTGATTAECARVLKHEAGVRRIVVVTVARG